MTRVTQRALLFVAGHLGVLGANFSPWFVSESPPHLSSLLLTINPRLTPYFPHR